MKERSFSYDQLIECAKGILFGKVLIFQILKTYHGKKNRSTIEFSVHSIRLFAVHMCTGLSYFSGRFFEEYLG